MAGKYEVDYNDKRLTDVKAEQKAELNEVDVNYGNIIGQADKFYQDRIDASQDWADKQTQLQQQQTDFAIDKIEQQKDQTKKDYIKEQSGAYTDWQKQSNQYGANAEQMAANGLTNSGFSESSQVSMYNTYQNRVTAARESYNQAVLNYNNAITEARLQNNSVLAEIAYEALQQQLELSLQGFQYKNQLVKEQADKKLELKKYYSTEYQNVLSQINREKEFAFERDQAEIANKRQQAQLEIAQAELRIKQEQWAQEKKERAAAAATRKATSTARRVAKSATKAVGSAVKKQVEKGTKSTTTKSVSAREYLNKLIASGASKDKVANEIAIALREGAITKQEAEKLRSTFTPRGLAY